MGLKLGNVGAELSSHIAHWPNGRWRRDASGWKQSVPGWHLYDTYVLRGGNCVPAYFIQPSG